MKTVLNFYLLMFFCVAYLGSCAFIQPIKDGKTAFTRKQYAKAIPMLTAEYKKAESKKDKSKIAFMLGECYRLNMNDEKAIDWYKSAYDQQYGTDALKEYAYSLKRTEQYGAAAQQFKDLGIEIGTPYEYRREITACLQSEAWKKDAIYSGYSILSAGFSGAFSDFAPVVYEKDKVIFTSDRTNPQQAPLKKESKGTDAAYAWTGYAYSDIFMTDKNEVSAFDPVINTRHNEGSPTFNSDLTELYFTRCFTEDKFGDAYCRIMSSHRTPDGWSDPFTLPFQKDRVNYGHPSITKDGSLLFFSSNDPDGWGGHDIYVCEKTPEGWSDPKLLGRSINSPGNEQFPEIDGDTLYFSSDYITGMGGLDIFRSYKTNSGEWSPPQNLKSPVNSGSDDFGFVIDRLSDKQAGILAQGYFTSNRSGGKGKDDIYQFERRVPPPRPVVDTPQVANIKYKIIIAGYVVEKIFAIPGNPNSKVIGRKPVPGSNISVSFGNEKNEYIANGDGYFSFEAAQNMDYRFFASQDGFLNATTFFSTKGIGQDPANPVQTFEVELLLDKIYRDQEIVLPNIYYDFDRWDIRTDAQPTLDNLAQLLFQNPDIKIQLSSHTDCRGNDIYNADLSQKRAESAVQYLIMKGIVEDRLTAKGYGEGVPAVTCACARCTEEEHQANRRTAFKIL